MARAILEFNLPDEQAEFDSAKYGARYEMALWDGLNEIRQILKYTDPTAEVENALDQVRTRIMESLDGTPFSY